MSRRKRIMSFFLPRLSKALIAVSVVLGVALHAHAADTQAPDTDELYAYLFPDAPALVHNQVQPTTAAVNAAAIGGALSGFKDLNRHTAWSEQQVGAMKGAFARRAPAQPATPVTVQAVSDAGPLSTLPMALADSPYADLINQYAKKRNLDPRLIHQMILAESKYKTDAVSPRGAKGLMQLMDSLSEQFNIDPFDPESNINVGTQYFAGLMARYNSVDLALAAFNAGPAAVDKYSGVPPFPETQNYISSIKAGMAQMEARNP
jgi:soluble lytic murein transglycosylase-like protein